MGKDYIPWVVMILVGVALAMNVWVTYARQSAEPPRMTPEQLEAAFERSLELSPMPNRDRPHP